MATDQPGPLAAAAGRKHDAAIARAGAAVRELHRTGAVINFQAVARAAGVSRQCLYRQPDLRLELDRLRTTSRPAGTAAPAGQRATEASPRQRIRSLLDDNHRLRDESDELPAELALAYGERRDSRRDA